MKQLMPPPSPPEPTGDRKIIADRFLDWHANEIHRQRARNYMHSLVNSLNDDQIANIVGEVKDDMFVCMFLLTTLLDAANETALYISLAPDLRLLSLSEAVNSRHLVVRTPGKGPNEEKLAGLFADLSKTLSTTESREMLNINLPISWV